VSDGPVSFRVLGPLDVSVGGSSLRIAAPRQRALLAQLLLNVNGTSSASALIEGIWGDSLPEHPEAALHILVCRLRHALDVVAPRLIRDGSGYRIEAADHEFDLMFARSRFARGVQEMNEARMSSAAAAFDAALACWTGESLAWAADFPFYHGEARALRDFQLDVVEQRNEAYFRCGRQLEVLRDIDAWIAIEPWRERLRAHKMVALYCAGRQVEALAEYDELRAVLVSDFGVAPNEELQALHQSILRQDPELLTTLAEVQSLYETMTPVPDPSVEFDVRTLIGRLREVADGRDVVIVHGGPNVDKTWLVVEVSGRIKSCDRVTEGDDNGDMLRQETLGESLSRVRRRLANPQPKSDTA
jgi:DNA-binding SARP family transcriptional activator